MDQEVKERQMIKMLEMGKRNNRFKWDERSKRHKCGKWEQKE